MSEPILDDRERFRLAVAIASSIAPAIMASEGSKRLYDEHAKDAAVDAMDLLEALEAEYVRRLSDAGSVKP